MTLDNRRENETDGLYIHGLPDTLPEGVAAACRSRLLRDVNELLAHVDTPDLAVSIGTRSGLRALLGTGEGPGNPDDAATEHYSASAPLYAFEQLVLPEQLADDLLMAIEVLRVEKQVFDLWGLKAIEPFPRTALNFYGPPGTGKTLAAHAIAERLSRPILVASYAEIESKYHGDGPKNVKAIFKAAERQGAVLFIDEADSLLSQRLTNVTQGSEQAINSMRSQLLICLEQFTGVVIFSTNLVENYDKAFETRVRYFEFTLPDERGRAEIWRRLLPHDLPLDASVQAEHLARISEGACGRDIKNAIIDAAVRAAVKGQGCLAIENFVDAWERIRRSKLERPRDLSPDEKIDAEEKIRKALGERAATVQMPAASPTPDEETNPHDHRSHRI